MKSWGVRFLESFDPKWLSALLIGVIGVGGSLKAGHDIDAQKNAVQIQQAHQLGSIDSLRIRVRLLERQVRTLKRKGYVTIEAPEPKKKSWFKFW